MEEPPKKYFRMFPGNEVRLMSAYFVTCTGCEKDAEGRVTVVHGTYDPATKSGSGFTERKVKGTIHWVAADTAKKVSPAHVVRAMQRRAYFVIDSRTESSRR